MLKPITANIYFSKTARRDWIADWREFWQSEADIGAARAVSGGQSPKAQAKRRSRQIQNACTIMTSRRLTRSSRDALI